MVTEADPAAADEARKPVLALAVDRFGDPGRARRVGALFAQPRFQRRQKRCAPLVTDVQPLVRGEAVDAARDIELMLLASVPRANQNASSGVSAVSIVAAVTVAVAVAAVTVAVAAVDMRAVTSPSARPPATVVAGRAASGVARHPALQMATATLNCSIHAVEARGATHTSEVRRSAERARSSATRAKSARRTTQTELGRRPARPWRRGTKTGRRTPEPGRRAGGPRERRRTGKLRQRRSWRDYTRAENCARR